MQKPPSIPSIGSMSLFAVVVTIVTFIVIIKSTELNTISYQQPPQQTTSSFDLSIVRDARPMVDALSLDTADIVKGSNNWALVHIIPWQNSIVYNTVSSDKGRVYFKEDKGEFVDRQGKTVDKYLPAQTIQIKSVLSGNLSTDPIDYTWTERNKLRSMPYTDDIFWSGNALYPYITRDGYAIMRVDKDDIFGSTGYLVPEKWIPFAEELKNSEQVRNSITKISGGEVGTLKDIIAQANLYVFAYGLNALYKSEADISSEDLQLLLTLSDHQRRGIAIVKLLNTYNIPAHKALLASAKAESDPAMIRTLLLVILANNGHHKWSESSDILSHISRDQREEAENIQYEIVALLLKKMESSPDKEALETYLREDDLMLIRTLEPAASTK